jgi:hypothetical protein
VKEATRKDRKKQQVQNKSKCKMKPEQELDESSSRLRMNPMKLRTRMDAGAYKIEMISYIWN